jgi:hypothetical protein
MHKYPTSGVRYSQLGAAATCSVSSVLCVFHIMGSECQKFQCICKVECTSKYQLSDMNMNSSVFGSGKTGM